MGIDGEEVCNDGQNRRWWLQQWVVALMQRVRVVSPGGIYHDLCSTPAACVDG